MSKKNGFGFTWDGKKYVTFTDDIRIINLLPSNFLEEGGGNKINNWLKDDALDHGKIKRFYTSDFYQKFEPPGPDIRPVFEPYDFNLDDKIANYKKKIETIQNTVTSKNNIDGNLNSFKSILAKDISQNEFAEINKLFSETGDTSNNIIKNILGVTEGSNENRIDLCNKFLDLIKEKINLEGNDNDNRKKIKEAIDNIENGEIDIEIIKLQEQITRAKVELDRIIKDDNSINFNSYKDYKKSLVEAAAAEEAAVSARLRVEKAAAEGTKTLKSIVLGTGTTGAVTNWLERKGGVSNKVMLGENPNSLANKMDEMDKLQEKLQELKEKIIIDYKSIYNDTPYRSLGTATKCEYISKLSTFIDIIIRDNNANICVPHGFKISIYRPYSGYNGEQHENLKQSLNKISGLPIQPSLKIDNKHFKKDWDNARNRGDFESLEINQNEKEPAIKKAENEKILPVEDLSEWYGINYKNKIESYKKLDDKFNTPSKIRYVIERCLNNNTNEEYKGIFLPLAVTTGIEENDKGTSQINHANLIYIQIKKETDGEGTANVNYKLKMYIFDPNYEPTFYIKDRLNEIIESLNKIKDKNWVLENEVELIQFNIPIQLMMKKTQLRLERSRLITLQNKKYAPVSAASEAASAGREERNNLGKKIMNEMKVVRAEDVSTNEKDNIMEMNTNYETLKEDYENLVKEYEEAKKNYEEWENAFGFDEKIGEIDKKIVKAKEEECLITKDDIIESLNKIDDKKCKLNKIGISDKMGVHYNIDSNINIHSLFPDNWIGGGICGSVTWFIFILWSIVCTNENLDFRTVYLNICIPLSLYKNKLDYPGLFSLSDDYDKKLRKLYIDFCWIIYEFLKWSVKMTKDETYINKFIYKYKLCMLEQMKYKKTKGEEFTSFGKQIMSTKASTKAMMVSQGGKKKKTKKRHRKKKKTRRKNKIKTFKKRKSKRKKYKKSKRRRKKKSKTRRK